MDPLHTTDNPPTQNPVVTPVTPVTPATPTMMPPSMPPETPPMQTGHVEKSHKMLYLIIGVLLLILIALAGLFFYNQISNVTSAENNIVVPTAGPDIRPSIVIPTYASEEETEVMGVEVGAVDSQLNIIENDVNKL